MSYVIYYWFTFVNSTGILRSKADKLSPKGNFDEFFKTFTEKPNKTSPNLKKSKSRKVLLPGLEYIPNNAHENFRYNYFWFSYVISMS